MIIQHNMQAMNANRMLGITTGSQSKATEKLSSGYRINRAADDAAGLSISEKMRKQIRGLDRASANAQDGISCVQTAEGALTEVHSMLQRMNELAVQAANGTMSQDDRQALQDEVDQLITEIDRVSETTKFNEIYLLKGDKDNTEEKTREVVTAEMTAAYIDTPEQKIEALDKDNPPTWYLAGSADALADADAIIDNLVVGDDGKITTKDGKALYKEAADPDTAFGAQKTLVSADDIAQNFGVSSDALYSDEACTKEVKDEDLKEYFEDDGIYKGGLWKKDPDDDNKAKAVNADHITRFVTVTAAVKTEETYTVAGALDFNLHVGSESAAPNKINVKIDAMSANGIGVDVLKGNGIMSEDSATAAIDTVANAISQVSKQRSALGAVQNRLEHTIANLDNVSENTTAAESRIRDTDMAETMVEYSKNNILAQAGQSMLAQANQATQGVLSLLG